LIREKELLDVYGRGRERWALKRGFGFKVNRQRETKGYLTGAKIKKQKGK